MPKRSRIQPTTVDPRKLTTLIGQAQHVWGKLRWEAVTLQRARSAQPFEVESLVNGAINFAVTSAALEDWLCKAAVRRLSGISDEAKFRSRVATAVPMQAAYRDIANTFKHGAYRDANWKGGTVELVHFPAFAETEREYVLVYHSDEQGTLNTSLDAFDMTVQHWAEYIRLSGLFDLLAADFRAAAQPPFLPPSPEST